MLKIKDSLRSRGMEFHVLIFIIVGLLLLSIIIVFVARSDRQFGGIIDIFGDLMLSG